MNLAAYSSGFLMGTVKFMFAATSMMAFSVSYWEVVFATFLGAFVSFNIFFFFSGLLMERAKEKKWRKLKKERLSQKNNFLE